MINVDTIEREYATLVACDRACLKAIRHDYFNDEGAWEICHAARERAVERLILALGAAIGERSMERVAQTLPYMSLPNY